METAPCTSVAFGSKKPNSDSDLPISSLNTPATCLLHPSETIWRYIHTNGLHTSFSVLRETTCFLTWTSRCVQVAMPPARRAAGSWAVQASLMSRHPGHVSISMRKGPACWTNGLILDRNILNLEWCCSILSGPKNRAAPVCGHAFDVKPCGPSSTCSSTKGLGLIILKLCAFKSFKEQMSSEATPLSSNPRSFYDDSGADRFGRNLGGRLH